MGANVSIGPRALVAWARIDQRGFTANCRKIKRRMHFIIRISFSSDCLPVRAYLWSFFGTVIVPFVRFLRGCERMSSGATFAPVGTRAGAARREVEGLSRATFFAFLSERTSRLRDGYGRARGGVGSVGRLFGDADRESRRGGRRARGRDLTSTDAVRARALARRTSRDMSFRPPPARRARGTRARPPSYRPTPHLRLSEKASFVTPPDRFSRRLTPHLPDRRRARTLEMWLALRNQRVKLHLFSGFVAPRSAPKRPARALPAPSLPIHALFPSRVWAAR